MSISNVNNANKIDLTKLVLGKKAQKAQANQPAYMQMTGSIFNAPQVKKQTTTTNLTTLNTNRSLKELNQNQQTTNNKQTDNNSNVNQSNVQSLGSQAKKGTQQTEQNTKLVNKYTEEGKKLSQNTKKDEKKFQAQLKQQQASILKDNQKLEKLIQESDEAQQQIDNAQNELDGLLASSSFTYTRNNGAQGGQSTNSNQDKIKELQTLIGSKTNLVQSNGKQIYSLRRSSSRTISRMNRTNANFIKVNKQNAKAIKQNQNETSNVIKVATKIEQYSALAEQGGQALDLLGQGLVAAGQALASTPWGAAAGAAMIATGTAMSKVGTVVEMVGQYGQTAANITKTAAYAAEGNLIGAMTSAASAMQSGAAAQKSTKGLKDTFGQIDQRAENATNKAAANMAAKQSVKTMSDEELGGMTKKEMKKSISSQLQEQMANKELNSKDLVNDVKNKAIKSNDAVAGARDKAVDAFKTNVETAKGSLDVANGVVTGLDKKTRKKVGAKTVSGFTNSASKAIKTTQKFDFQKLNQGVMSTVALYNAQNTGSTQGSHAGYVSQWNLSADPKMRKIMKYNRSMSLHNRA